MTDSSLNRRNFLAGACSVAAAPFISPPVLARPDINNRLVVVVLRGGMDSLAAVQPRGDPLFAKYRPRLAAADARHTHRSLDLGGGFALNPAMQAAADLWRSDELAFVQAVSTPYRDRRSHFEGQDILENGTGNASRRSGWLNRALTELPRGASSSALETSGFPSLTLRGRADIDHWRPDIRRMPGPHTYARLMALYRDDPAFAEALTSATALDKRYPPGRPPSRGGKKPASATLDLIIRSLRGDVRVALMSFGGWDSHAQQITKAKASFERLAEMIVTLKAGVGPAVWDKTIVVFVTEFGRTVRENGSVGTDHGTGGAMLLAGGALRGGRLYGKWPGLGESDLLAGRDLCPTDDLRRYLGWVLRDHLEIPAKAIEDTVFPGVLLGASPRLLG